MKVSAAVSVTLNLGNFQSTKFDFGVEGIDTDAPLQPQLDACAEHLLGTAGWVENKLFEKLQADRLVEVVKMRPPGVGR